ncbi:MAG: dioxygenase, partial [Pseudomonadota bacterium]
MRNVTKDNITDVFLSYFGPDTDPRLKEIVGSLAHHLHAFAKDVDLTHAEWNVAIDFLERMTEFTTKERHEFVLLSDVFGLSSLVDMINSNPKGTSSSV